MDLNEQLDDIFNEEELDLETRTAFLEVAKWSKWLVLLVGIGLGFIGLFTLGGLLFSGSMGLGVVVVTIMSFLCGIPIYYLYQFTVKSKEAIEELDDVLFTYALQNLKSFFKFWGVLTLLLVAYYAFNIFLIFV